MKFTIDLSWSESNPSINAIVKQVKINHFSYDCKKERCRIFIKEKNIDKLVNFLNVNQNKFPLTLLRIVKRIYKSLTTNINC